MKVLPWFLLGFAITFAVGIVLYALTNRLSIWFAAFLGLVAMIIGLVAGALLESLVSESDEWEKERKQLRDTIPQDNSKNG